MMLACVSVGVCVHPSLYLPKPYPIWPNYSHMSVWQRVLTQPSVDLSPYRVQDDGGLLASGMNDFIGPKC